MKIIIEEQGKEPRIYENIEACQMVLVKEDGETLVMGTAPDTLGFQKAIQMIGGVKSLSERFKPLFNLLDVVEKIFDKDKDE